jgi:hypothetical protein
VTVAQNPADKEALKGKTQGESVQSPPLPPAPNDLGNPMPPGPSSVALSTEELLKKNKALSEQQKKQEGPAPVLGPGGAGQAQVPAPSPAGGPTPVPAPGSSSEDKTKKTPESSPVAVPAVPEGVKPGPSADVIKTPIVISPDQQNVTAPKPANPAGLPGQGGVVVPAAPTVTDVVPPAKETVNPGPKPLDNPPPPAANTNNPPAGRPDRPMGGLDEAAGPPLRAAATGGEGPGAAKPPQVRDYYSKKFVCTDKVRSFDAISKESYGSEKYGLALLLFNRDGPGIDGVNNGAALLPVGQAVLLPPVAVLEDRYPGQIRDYRPPSSAAIVTGPPVAVTPPAVTPGPTPMSSGQAAPGPDYRVQGNGEMLYEIARNTLGDGHRWPEIYRLNPNVQPQQAIPGGTVLHLPLGARVGAY